MVMVFGGVLLSGCGVVAVTRVMRETSSCGDNSRTIMGVNTTKAVLLLLVGGGL